MQFLRYTVFCFIFFTVGTALVPAQTVTMAVAANVRPVVDELLPFLEREIHSTVTIVPGSSGQLASQTIAGAPYDIFLSADTENCRMLSKLGFAASPTAVYAFGKLVIWSMSATLSSDSLRLLLAPSIKTIAIANPRLAPYGAAAMSALRHFQLDEAVKSKLVYGESITQVNRYIYSGVADVGFTSLSSVISRETLGKGNWVLVDSTAYNPIAQGMVLLSHGRESVQAQKCFTLLLSDTASAAFRRFGYSMPASVPMGKK